MANSPPKLTANLAPTPDGGQLSYYTTGTGPSLLILHGSVTYALSHSELAVALSPYFTVHLASRLEQLASGGMALISPSTLAFRDQTEIERLLHEAGFADVSLLGGWDGRPFSAGSSEIIAIAR